MRERNRLSILHDALTLSAVSQGAASRTRAAALLFAACTVLTALSRGVHAQCTEQQFQNYSGGGQTACPCFVVGEQAGAVFTLPASVYPIEILRVGIGWGSVFSGQPQSLEEAIHIYAGGLPNPGSPIFSLPGPLMTDGAINEFNLGPLPGEITIPSGPFTVTLEFANENAGNLFAPSVIHDGNGCQSGKNVIFADPGGWLNACAEGVTGDWVFYVKYRSLKVTGSANPVETVFSDPPLSQTTCDTVYVVNSGCGDMQISSITGCGSAPFSIDTTPTSMTVPPGGSTPILVCVTPTGATTDSCLVTVTSNASNGPITFNVVLDVNATGVNPPALDGFAIVGVVPNPFNPSTRVRFTLPSALPVTAEVWSVRGERIRNLAGGTTFGPGEHALRWDGRNDDGQRVASGVYMFRVSTPMGQRVARMVLVQ